MKAMITFLGTVAYIANSINTKVGGTFCAGLKLICKIEVNELEKFDNELVEQIKKLDEDY